MKKAFIPVCTLLLLISLGAPVISNAEETSVKSTSSTELLFNDFVQFTPEIVEEGIQPRIKVATLRYKTQAFLTRANASSPWVLQSEQVFSTTEVRYNTGWRTEYRIDSVQEYPASEAGGPNVLRFENRTYKYTGY
ncbi:hypothetical protein [Enterococcus asini]|uniref:hypothetical protein n=1 Tax=Enterococcus asini TaxID=57732 RepID=UPI001E4F32F2|nr:hypothetical protein [Enterococcus asini]MCD5029249.1 hypothetical protein [Enterococcus asini]